MWPCISECKLIWKPLLGYNTTVSCKIAKADMTSTRMNYAQLFQQVWRFWKLIFTPQKKCKWSANHWLPWSSGFKKKKNPKSIHDGLLCKEVNSKVKYIWLVVLLLCDKIVHDQFLLSTVVPGKSQNIRQNKAANSWSHDHIMCYIIPSSYEINDSCSSVKVLWNW